MTLFLSGCAFLKSRDLPKTYSIAIERDKDETQKFTGLDHFIIDISPFSANKPFDSKLFQILAENKVWKEDYYNRLFLSPDILIGQELRKWLSDTENFGAVALPVFHGDANLVINGNVEEFYVDASDPEAPQSAISIRLLVEVDQSSNGGKKVSQVFEYDDKMPIPRLHPEYVIEGWEIIIGVIFSTFESDLTDFLMDLE